jgi:hypothetical protein
MLDEIFVIYLQKVILFVVYLFVVISLVIGVIIICYCCCGPYVLCHESFEWRFQIARIASPLAENSEIDSSVHSNRKGD